jgi:quercetin dioxygenase-like cupin family protein
VVEKNMSLRVRRLSEESWEPWIGEGYENASSLMIVQKMDAVAVSCRIIKLEPGGHTGIHSHERIHSVIAVDGEAAIETNKEKIKLGKLVTATVPPEVPHRFVNTGNEPAIIIVQNIFQK